MPTSGRRTVIQRFGMYYLGKSGQSSTTAQDTAQFDVYNSGKIRLIAESELFARVCEKTRLRRKTTKTYVSIYDKFVVPIMSIVEKLFTPPLDKNLLVVGKKH